MIKLLDRPTNHLDMHSKDILKEALKKFDGTLIVVSHDREFLDGLISKIYEFENQRVKEYLGDIYNYLNLRYNFVCSPFSLQRKIDRPAPIESVTAITMSSLYAEHKERQR